MVSVLTEAPVERLPVGQRWYSKQEGFIAHRNQAFGWPVFWDQHPDPLVECARRLITEAGLEQALARGRIRSTLCRFTHWRCLRPFQVFGRQL